MKHLSFVLRDRIAPSDRIGPRPSGRGLASVAGVFVYVWNLGAGWKFGSCSTFSCSEVQDRDSLRRRARVLFSEERGLSCNYSVTGELRDRRTGVTHMARRDKTGHKTVADAVRQFIRAEDNRAHVRKLLGWRWNQNYRRP